MKALLLAIVAVLSCPIARASDPVGIYGIVDKVIVEPNPTAPERIQIWGTFSLAKPGGAGDQYTDPQSGYLYYKVKTGEKKVGLNEWADMKAVAGTDHAIAFAGRHQNKGRLRQPNEKPSNPDEYPVAQGITKVKKSEYSPVKRLYEAAALATSETKPAVKSEKKAE